MLSVSVLPVWFEMGRSSLGAHWNDVIVDEIIWHWGQHNGLSNPAHDISNALQDAKSVVELRLDQAVAPGDIIRYATHFDIPAQLLIFSIEFQDNVWRGEFNCKYLTASATINTKQEIHIDTKKAPPPPTSSAPMTTKTMNIPIDPVADYDRAMKGLG